MAGRRWDTNITELMDFSPPDWCERLRTLALDTNRQRPSCWMDYFVFPRGQYRHKVPPFAVGRPDWDRWMIWFTRRSHTPVVDASRSVIAVHQDHDYSHHPLGFKGVMHGEEAKSNARLLGGARHLFTTENAQYRSGETGLKWNYRHLLVDFLTFRRAVAVTLWAAWFDLLDLTRPLRHALGLKAEEGRGTLSAYHPENVVLRWENTFTVEPPFRAAHAGLKPGATMNEPLPHK